jgi:ribosomal protein L15
MHLTMAPAWTKRPCGKRLVNGRGDGVKVLGWRTHQEADRGGNAFSTSAKDKIEGKGGKCEVVKRSQSCAVKG